MKMSVRTHLQQLEAESIHIMREVAAECQRPVLLYSIGKDSSVMVRLAQKAFFPGRIPFPLLHVDTGYKFKEMIEFRDRYTAELGVELIVTDIGRDGAMTGPNVEMIGAVADAVAIPTIASGGMSSVADIVALKARRGSRIAGAILGRALYEGAIDPTEALCTARRKAA